MTEQLRLFRMQVLDDVSRAAQTYGQAIIDRKDLPSHSHDALPAAGRLTSCSEYESQEQELRESFQVREREQNAVIEGLKLERDDLRRQLQGRRSDSPKAASQEARSSAFKTTSPPPTTPHLTSDKTDWQTAYGKLRHKFTALDSNFKKAREALERRKIERDHWAAQFASLQEKLNALQGKQDDRVGAKCDDAGPSSNAPTSKRTTSTPPQPTSASSLLHDRVLPPQVGPIPRQQGAVTPGSAPTPGSTQSDPDEEKDNRLPPLPALSNEAPPRIKQEPSSDTPVVMSARPVRKRKRGESQGEPATAKVKVEAEMGSSPIPRLDRFMLSSEDSLDLGEVAQRITTPRKPRELTGDVRPEPIEEHPPPLAITAARPELYVKATPKLVRPSPLTPIDANRRIVRASGKPADPTRRRKEIEQGIGALAEDGTSYEPRRNLPNGGVETPVFKNRVDNLLNTPNVGHLSPNISGSVARKIGKPSTPRNDLMMPKPRALPFDKSARATVQQPVAESQIRSPAATTPSAPPKKRSTGAPKRKLGELRKKPLSALKLDDFKINPAVNEGLNYAFTDVVRDRSERAALPGCTDPHCCGAEFRALALSQKPNPPLTSEQKREEQRLLEEYLGDHAYQLAAMDGVERSETWVRAKTHELANKFGKHRHRYARMRSPPGFWNADFPSTQELEAEKAEAAERERKSIEERHREAMRANGRWVFRDEVEV
ncbi:DNA repair protein/CtIP [Sarocladium implicatum]|nr:DNA repair protein/CtIP [Sarocladium implicatum]